MKQKGCCERLRSAFGCASMNLIWIKFPVRRVAKVARAAKVVRRRTAPGRENLDLGEPTGSKSNSGRVATAHVQAVIG